MKRQLFRIIYPETRTISDSLIISWYNDAVLNDEVDDKSCKTVEEMANELDSAGIITLGK